MSLLTNKKLYLNIGVALALFFLIILCVLLSLKSWTRHGESIPLPDFVGCPVADLEQFAREHYLRYMVTDSVYNDTLPKGTIVLQDPYPNSGVKRGRKIYITVVSSLPESVVMPNVVNLSVRQAVSLIYGNDLTIKKIDFVSGFDKNAVQRQLLDGEEVEPGVKLKKYTAVTLVASKGERPEPGKVPNLKGLTRKEAIQRIYQNSFNVGNIVGGEENSKAVVISQTPASDNATYPLGHKVNFRLSSDGKKGADDNLDSIMWKTILLEQQNNEDVDETHADNAEDADNEDNSEEIF
jgi:beta-lactam-binding protein with PASTA domain